jgi:photosystem II stability/assembly factor-like uncharacterized protein
MLVFAVLLLALPFLGWHTPGPQARAADLQTFTIGQPFTGSHDITAWFDHENPNYVGDGFLVRYDGQRLRSGGADDCTRSVSCYDGHSGTDYSMVTGTPVLAVADGTVSHASRDGDFGETVDIDHGNGYTSRYSHLSQYQVSDGDTVSRGQVIALSGNTGWSTAAHLHFEVKKNGLPLDPFGWQGDYPEPCAQNENGSCAPAEYLWGDPVDPTPNYSYELVGQTPAEIFTLNSQGPTTLEVRIKNPDSSNVTWYGDNLPGCTVHLGTGSSHGSDEFAAFDHRSPLYESGLSGWVGLDGNRVRMQEAEVQPGEIATFRFAIAVPNMIGELKQYWTPVVDGPECAENQWMEDVGIHFWMRVFPYCYSFVDRSPPMDSWHTQPGTFEISLRNECSQPWFKSADIAGNDSDVVVHLGTGKPDVTDDANSFANQDHSSPFCTSGSTGWVGSDCNRIEMVEDRVNQGEVATFRFAAGVPTLAQPIESHFTPVVEEVGWMSYQQDTMLRVNNNPYRATWQGQEPAEPFVMRIGEKHNLQVSFTNEGHKTWQQSNVNLGVVGPDDNSERYNSPFYDSSWLEQDRPTVLDQAEVAPGAVGSFSFTVQTPNTPGTYKLRVRPVADGEWWMEEQTMDVYWMITVEGEPVTNDCSRFISDVTIPDGTVVAPGETVQKTWQLENCGDTTWNGYRAIRIDGTFGPESFDAPSVSPGERADIGVEITAPTEPGMHRTVYKLEGPRGQFGTNFFIQVTVGDNSGGISIIHTQQQGFDACTAPALDTMQKWSEQSPYRYIGIYIGGSSRACSQPALTASWVEATTQQGWNFLPIWVGPQAPCTSFRSRMSSDQATARNQGQEEANKALDAAAMLGLGDASGSGTLIYYDMEGYNTNNQQCRDTVNAFLDGWVAQMHARGSQTGIYGSSSASAADDWYHLEHRPDMVWLAHWYTNKYNPAASPYNVFGVADNHWNGQRIRQYAGDFDDNWGGVSIAIDANVADGSVVGQNPSLARLSHQASRQTALLQTPPAVTNTTAASIDAVQFVTAEQGWMVRGDNLYWTTTSGEHWDEVSPSLNEQAAIQRVFFLDPTYGWVVSSQPVADATTPVTPLTIHRTTDGGVTWEALSLESFDVTESGAAVAANVFLDFLDAQTGWLVVQLPSSSNFSRGRFFSTTDGGITWTEQTIPIGEAVRFITADIGWTAGGPAGNELYRTSNGGATWSQQTIATLTAISNTVTYALPTFENDQEGVLPVTISDSEQPRVEIYTTDDAGQTWSLAETVSVNRILAPGTSLPVAVIDANTWMVASSEDSSQLPDDISDMMFVTGTAGWLQTRSGSCNETRLICSVQSQVFTTTDNGNSWTEVPLPIPESNNRVYLPLIQR